MRRRGESKWKYSMPKCILCKHHFKLYQGNSYYCFVDNTEYYGDSFNDIRDPHNELGYICYKCSKDIMKDNRLEQ